MKKWLIVACIAAVIFGFTRIGTNTKKGDPNTIANAINKSIPILQKAGHTFLENAGGCHSCHHHALTAVNLSMAKEKGFSINDTLLEEALSYMTKRTKSWKPYSVEYDDPTAIVMSGGYDLWALSANHHRSDKRIELLVKNLMHRQTNEGCWVSASQRPPLEYYSFSATALMVRAMQNYPPPLLSDEIVARTKKARSWLINTNPETNEERIFQLLGLKWSKADDKIIQQQAKKLLAAQREDGGWSQLTSLQSDAYATGQSLYALNQTGQLKVNDPAYQKGISFLLNTQLVDGSWKVTSRSFPVIPFVETGFPHEKNQFISAAGTNWADLALLSAVNK